MMNNKHELICICGGIAVRFLFKGMFIFAMVLILCLFPVFSKTNNVPEAESEPGPGIPLMPEAAQAPFPEPSPAPDTASVPNSTDSPAITTAPEASPVPSAKELPIKSDVEVQAEAERRELEAASFKKEVEAIVMKHVNSFYKNGGKGTIGIYIRELRTGYEFGYNDAKTNPSKPEEGYFKTASTCKLMSAAVIYYLNNNGLLELSDTLTDKVTGIKYKLKQLVPRMISHSVNEYFNITLRQLGGSKINEVLQLLGAKNSFVYSEIMPAKGSSINANIKRYGISKSPRTNPRDLGHLLTLLHDGKTFGEENSKALTDALIANIYSNRLPQGIGYKSPVAHKTGTSAGEGVYNDAGIIYLERNPYVMVVMSKDSISSVQSLFRKIAAEVYDYMKKRAE